MHVQRPMGYGQSGELLDSLTLPMASQVTCLTAWHCPTPARLASGLCLPVSCSRSCLHSVCCQTVQLTT